MRASRALTTALFSAIVLLAVDPVMLLLAFEDRELRHEVLSRRADPDPELAAFLAGVRERTREGDSILLILPVRQWERYSGAYFRAGYLLAGRTVLPIIATDGRVVRENVERADYVAAWRVRFTGGTPVWSGAGGTLVRRR